MFVSAFPVAFHNRSLCESWQLLLWLDQPDRHKIFCGSGAGPRATMSVKNFSERETPLIASAKALISNALSSIVVALRSGDRTRFLASITQNGNIQNTSWRLSAIARYHSPNWECGDRPRNRKRLPMAALSGTTQAKTLTSALAGW